MTQYDKDPDAILDYAINWETWLDGDTISASAWSAAADITIDSDSHTDTVATVWLSGGTAGNTYTVTNHITTAGGREDERSIRIRVLER